MVANYRGIAALWLVMCLFIASPVAFGEGVKAGEFELSPDQGWHRAPAEAEASAASVILFDGAGLEVDLPHRQTRLNTSPDNFFHQIDTIWRMRYGQQASMSWLDAAGTRWRVCRRPSLEGPDIVFQLVTVHAGDIYQVLVIAPPGTTALPESVGRLLKQGRWGVAEPEPAIDESEPPATGREKPLQEKSDDISPAPPPATYRWRLLRTLVAPGRAGEKPQITLDELARLGRHARLSGLAVHVSASRLDWSLDAEDGDEARPYRVNWQVEWKPPPDELRPGHEFALTPSFRNLSGSGMGAGFGLSYGLVAVCGPQSVLTAWQDALVSGRERYDERVGELEAGCGHGDARAPMPLTLTADAKDIYFASLTVPKDWVGEIRPAVEGAVMRLLLVVRFMASPQGTAPGDALLKPVAVVYVYGTKLDLTVPG